MFQFFLINTCQSVERLSSSLYILQMPKLELMHLVYIEISSVEREDVEAEEKERQKNCSFLTASNDTRDLKEKKTMCLASQQQADAAI